VNRRNSGQIRIIEAFFAVLLIFSAFTVSTNLNVTQNPMDRKDLESIGFQTLMTLDSDGTLGEYIDSGNWTALRNAISLSLPAGTVFNLTVYDEVMRQLNPQVVSNGGFSSQDIYFAEYVCASRKPAYQCYILHLQLAVTA
jgi:hypothetical protein